jgi:hypothetical protein
MAVLDDCMGVTFGPWQKQWARDASSGTDTCNKMSKPLLPHCASMLNSLMGCTRKARMSNEDLGNHDRTHAGATTVQHRSQHKPSQRKA